MTAAADFGASALSAFVRAAGLLLLAVGAFFAFAFAFAAIIVVGIMIVGAAVAMRLMPKRAEAGAPEVLEARRTPSGWVVEGGAQRKS